MTTSTLRDPRTIITPDAFEVSSDLIGIPLALPRHRAAALLIDGVVIIFITMLTKSFSLILGVVAAGFFMRAGFKRTKVRGSVFGRAMRFSVGCLGLIIAITTASLWAVFGVGVGSGGPGPLSGDPDFDLASVAEFIPPGVDTAGLFGALDSLLDARDGTVEPESRPLEPETRTGPLAQEVAAYSDAEALRAYAALPSDDLAGDTSSQGGSAAADAGARRRLLEARLGPLVAADTIGVLNTRLAGLEREITSNERALARTSADLAAANTVGIRSRILGLADELGFGFGWAAIYLSVFLSWWNGQTVGKRMMRIRVVRLDGEPITWWVAFERAGGYAAGLFTGLLGFAQIWWDANRQAIHDRIVGTVVIQDGAEKVTDWEAAL